MRDLGRRALLAAVLVVAGSHLTLAQRSACYTIRPGDTAASLALRIAGHADRRHQPWFQIFDPATSRYVVKARYDHIRPGWLACIWEPQSSVSQMSVQAPATASILPGIVQSVSDIEVDPFWGFLILLLTTPFAWRAADRRRNERRAIVAEMMRFGRTFIREFERPLVQPRTSEPPMRSRLRFRPLRGQLEVLLAPEAGRRYPNLSDHRKNVEYDMERVLHALGNQPFVSGSPRQRGQWVIVPFRVRTDQKKEGAA